MEILYCSIYFLLIYVKFINGTSVNSKPGTTVSANTFVNITRHYDGDIIFIEDEKNCNENTCLELLGGSATLYKEVKASTKPTKCKCQCVSHLKTYREDDGYCVDTIRECSIIPFVSSITALDTLEKIPSVFLPLQGQIIYPSKELFLGDEVDTKCVIVDANYMTTHGWSDMKNSLYTNDIPFRLFNDKNRTFLQWSGDASYRSLLQGRLVILKLACWKDANINLNSIEDPLKTIRNLSSCISFRVLGSLLKHASNITEVQFSSESTGEKETFSSNEYIIIAISSFCLGVMYIASVFLYIYLKKKKDRPDLSISESNDKNFTRGVNIDLESHSSNYHRNSSLSTSMDFLDNPEANVIKSNPLMKHFLGFNENCAFVNDSSDADSSNKDDLIDNSEREFMDSQSMQSSNNQECIPDEDINITEDNDSKSSYGLQNNNTRRKLYFNPAYFEPELLASPPQAAVEFLTKIREVISMAKNKMTSKRFQPNLQYIPEEEDCSSESRKNTISSRRSNLNDNCTGCPGCSVKSIKNNQLLNDCKNCGDKNKSIQKWLENVCNDTNEVSTSSNFSEKSEIPLISKTINDEIIEEKSSADESLKQKNVKEELKIVKGFVKEKNIFVQRDRNGQEQILENDSIPKIISHSLKKNIKEMIYSQNFVRDKVNVFESKTHDQQSTNKYGETHEIYNNPKFMMDNDSEVNIFESNVNKEKQEVLDQYSNPIKRSNRKKNNNSNKMPDMVYEAIEMEKKNCKTLNYQSPTPDYSSEYEMTKFKASYDNVSFAPFVPTPDYYHTYSKNTLKNLKHYQPDSPIYSRKSPAYLIVDYETDSLERLNTLKSINRSALTPTKSDFSSSQPSPIGALPMEEEVEIRNALYDKELRFRKDTDTIKKEREIDIQMKKTKIKYNTPIEGSMTIELEGISPDENDENSDNSDEFEPDTLDRHTKVNRNLLSEIERATQIDNKLNVNDEFGRILTLEIRHSKRQRNVGEASLKKLPSDQHLSLKQSIQPDVISSNKPVYINRNQIKKSQISAPISSTGLELADKKVVNKTLRGEFLKMDLLSLQTNFLNAQLNSNDQSSLIKTIYHVDVPHSPQIFRENVKKTKDFKNAWKRFMGLASSKLKMYDVSDEDEENDKKKTTQKSINGIASEIKQGKVKDIVRKMSIRYMDTGKLRENDSGYLSAESLTNERVVFGQLASNNLNIEHNTKTLLARPSLPPPPVPIKTKEIPSSNTFDSVSNEDLINITIYSSDDDDDDQSSSIHDNDTHVDTCEDIDADSDFSFIN
ncbi:unnamed protein product [Chironomus riparius]|uniref:Shavenoid isoform B-like N-terminal domain-containing protein n=1 Tax=Chironomus riparius TaxID=315576 RepID=A0A9N9RMF1_9DIPT|nr:unnamed protein product [Chironomus riparius]